MLSGVLAIVLLATVAVGVWELKRWAKINAPLAEGVSYLLLGVLLGPRAFGLLPHHLLEQLDPLLQVGLAWIGLLFGMELDFSVLSKIKSWHRNMAVAATLAVSLSTLTAGLLLGMPIPEAVGLSSVASVFTPRLLTFMLKGKRPSDRATERLLKVTMALSGTVAVAIMAVASASLPTLEKGAKGFILCAGAGIVGGYSALVLVRGKRDRIQLLTCAIGVAALLAGIARASGSTPLLAGVAAGVVLANRLVLPSRFAGAVSSLEPALYAVLLLLIGAAWNPLGPCWKVFLILTAARAIGLFAAGRIIATMAASHAYPLAIKQPGPGLLAQGPMAVALILAGTQLGFWPKGAMEGGVLAILANHLAARLWIRRKLASEDG